MGRRAHNMSIDVSEVYSETTRPDGRIDAVYRFVDHNLVEYLDSWTLKDGVSAETFLPNAEADRQTKLEKSEVFDLVEFVVGGGDPATKFPPEHQTTKQLTRRALAYSATLTDIRKFYETKPIWVAFRDNPASGETITEQAAWLEVPEAELQEISDQYGRGDIIKPTHKEWRQAVWDKVGSEWRA